jgi:hypothetical protein
VWRIRAGVLLGLAAFIGAAIGCSVITGAYDFRVGSLDAGASDAEADAPERDPRLCAQCLEHPELVHPPCASQGAADDAGDPSYLFAVRSIDFGGQRGTWSHANYAAGLDQDCSSRADGGAPASCRPRTPPAEWVALPHGIDNALGTEVIAPLAEGALGKDGGGVDVEGDVNAWIAAGRGGVLVLVDGWNGAADDDTVGVRLAPAAHPAAGGAPTFAPNERWTAYDESAPTVTTAAYVSGSILVADFRSSAVRFRVGSVAGAFVELPLDGFVLVGKLTATGAAFSIGAYLGSLGQRLNVYAPFAQLAVGCDPAQQVGARAVVTQLLDTSYDLAVAPARDGGECNATSVGFLLDAVRAGSVVDPPEPLFPKSCPADAGP